MSNVLVKIGVLIISLILVGCSTIRSGLCKVRGGASYENLGGYQFCGKKYADAGKACTSSDECEGFCLLPWDWKPNEGREVKGRCEIDSTWEPIVGCVPIEKHKIYRGGCIEE